MSQLPPPPSTPSPAPPPSPPPTGAPGGTSGGVKALIAVVVLVIVAGGAFFVLSGDDGGGGPEQAVRDFFAAADDRDCTRMLSLVSEASWSQNGTIDRDQALENCGTEVQEAGFLPAGARLVDAKVTSQSGDTAEVEITTTSDEEGRFTETIPMAREDGRWLLDFASQFEDTEESTGG